jgi:hypothetical protein
MSQRIRSRLSFANVMSCVAVFIALGGTGYAAVKLPKNSVGAKQIKTNGVGSSEVKNGSLKKVDFKASDLPVGAQGPQGIQGIQGLQGLKGDKGNKGDTGAYARPTVQFNEAAADMANGAELSLDVHCPADQIAIGGGVRGDLTNSELTKVTASRPIIATDNSGAPGDDGTFTGGRGTFVNENNGTGIRPDVWVICVPPPTPAP